MRYTKFCFVVIVSLLVFSLIACSKKEGATTSPETSSEPAAPAINPDEMVLIPAGEFIFGTDDKASPPATPQQEIDLPAFWIDKYEVTNTEFLDFSSKTGYIGEGATEGKDWRAFINVDTARNPIAYITWNDAAEYCKSLGKRLPAEQEWEKAARGTDGRRYPWGNEWKPNSSNTYEAGYAKPLAVGKYEDVSPLGVHDMLGNVQEWTSSWYLPYKGTTHKDENYGEKFRVLRGASSRSYGERAHLWDRSAFLPNSVFDFGFRCAKDATPEDAAKAAQK